MGKVARVSGPVVQAEGLTGAKMFDVVRVGELGLVGEIIRLVGETATVQVYEDTTGIRPGDPVENTGQALSVELGPGLLKSIYDGVQRPLDVLKKNLGDFITRGFVAPPLDEKAVWTFTAVAKPGTEVGPGTILGTVQETPLILHKILVPPGLSGTLTELKTGDYTVRDKIGSLKTKDGVVPLGLSHKWVVRVPRPVQQKLAPGVPLLTGQRVIDTFYPIAKGGTACIPGPFGSGKCVGGETPVALGDGRILPIEDLYRWAQAHGERTDDGSDEWYRLREPLPMYSLVEGRVVRSESRTFYKGRSDTLVRVRTRSGRTVRLTPVHRIFAFRPDGRLRQTPARDLKAGDYVASVRSTPGPTEDAELPLEARRGAGSIPLPERMTPDLAEFLGLVVAAGEWDGPSTLTFASANEALLERFSVLAATLFGCTARRASPVGQLPRLRVRSLPLRRLCEALEGGGSTSAGGLPPSVIASSNAVLAAFLRGYYLAGGRLRDGGVELGAATLRRQTELSYALARFGVLARLGRAAEGSEFRVLVGGSTNLGRFVVALGLGASKLASLEPVLFPSRPAYLSSNPPRVAPEGIRPAERLDGGPGGPASLPGPDRLGGAGFVPGSSSPGGWSDPEPTAPEAGAGPELLDSLFGDEVLEVVEEREGPYDVYDVALPEYGANFVGGHGGMLLHNTVAQQQLAKWSDADVVVYVGCGERGNEMTEVLATFPSLVDPKSKRPLMERTILIANTSNMPVAAREASVYTGITIAEYYRDMGYDVALMADSTSRWAEAMREISGRLEEMPGEEGYPAYLGRRVAEFYERAGRVVTLSPDHRPGSVSVVGAVSPPGGDFSEPVSQNTLRVTRVFWALDAALASRRHFPSINWLQSYSLYVGDIEPWYREQISTEWVGLRQKAVELLQQESELQEIVQLVGVDALPEREKGILDVARMLREDYLQQSAYDDVDTYTSIQKQYRMLRAILGFGDKEQEAIAKGATVQALGKLPIRQKLSRMKWIPEAELQSAFDGLELEMGQAIASVTASGGP